MPEIRTVKGFSEVLLPFAEGDFESGPKDRFDTLLYILFHLCRRTTLFRLPRYFSKNKGFCQHKD